MHKGCGEVEILSFYATVWTVPPLFIIQRRILMNPSQEIPEDIALQYRHHRPIMFINSDTDFLVFQTESMSYTEETLGGYFNLFDVLRANHNQENGVRAGDLIGFQFYLPPIQSALSSVQKRKFGKSYPFFRRVQNFLPMGIPLSTLFFHVERVYPGVKVHPWNENMRVMIREYPARVRVPLL